MTTNSLPELLPPRFETSKPMILAGLAERHACQSPAGIPDQWQRFTSYIGNIPSQVDNVAYGACYNFDGDANFDYLCCVEVSSTSRLPPEFKTLQIPATKYVVFKHQGHTAGIRGTIAAIWSNWFPKSDYKAAEAPTLERYGPEFNPITGMGGLEIWIAIQS